MLAAVATGSVTPDGAQPNCTPPVLNLEYFPNYHDCIELQSVCVDQGTLVSFDPGLDGLDLDALPSLNLSDTVYNIPDK